MNFDKKTKESHKCNTLTINIAWNQIVQELISKGIYNKFINSDQSKVAVRFYGTVPGISWNGGRFNRRIGSLSIQELIDSVLWLNERNIGFNFTFNNTLINNSQLSDHFPNEVLQACQSSINGVVCASHLLSKYIKTKYPEYTRTLSCILSYHHALEFEKLFDEYDIVVLPEDLNPNFDYLKYLSNLEKIEMILNSSCIYKCPYRTKHYHLVNKDIQRETKEENISEWDDPCVEIFKTKKDWVVDNDRLTVDKQFIFPEILPAYVKLGIRHFKFLDRQQPPELKLLLDYWIILCECLESKII